MQAGLLKIMNSIRSNPNDGMLRQRYLALVSELKDGDEKAQSVLRLANAIYKTHPHEAMRLSHLVFVYDREMIESLEIMVRSLTELGRFGKAEVIRSELVKLKKLKESEGFGARGKDEVSLNFALANELAKTPPYPTQHDPAPEGNQRQRSSGHGRGRQRSLHDARIELDLTKGGRSKPEDLYRESAGSALAMRILPPRSGIQKQAPGSTTWQQKKNRFR